MEHGVASTAYPLGLRHPDLSVCASQTQECWCVNIRTATERKRTGRWTTVHRSAESAPSLWHWQHGWLRLLPQCCWDMFICLCTALISCVLLPQSRDMLICLPVTEASINASLCLTEGIFQLRLGHYSCHAWFHLWSPCRDAHVIGKLTSLLCKVWREVQSIANQSV